MRKSLLLSLLLVTFLFVGCNSSSNNYWIDNPTDKPITVYIDNISYDIPANTKKEVSIEYGKHQLKYNGQELTFHNGGRVNSTQAIINPTQSNYVFYKQIFMDPNDERATEEFANWAIKTQSDSLRLKINDSITTIFVPFQVSNKLFIDKHDFNWTYNVDEPMPEGITLSSPIVTSRNRQLKNDPNYKAGKFQEAIYKIYREQDFKDYLKQFGDDNIEFLETKAPYNELPKTKIVLTKIHNIQDTEYQEALQKHIAVFNEWLNDKGSNSTKGSKEVLMGNKLRELKSEYLKKYPKDYSFNDAVNEYDDQKQPFLLYQLNIIE
ncbi:hypothetical protein [Myroides injenensis]|uniref:hypothetical protein n=1 Tax=Myroides injenensis TaxID=1183151 RepID=UPI0002882A2F|nr:hypothetical protein [Myroides injenensis]